jgi:hypothetical protein
MCFKVEIVGPVERLCGRDLEQFSAGQNLTCVLAPFTGGWKQILISESVFILFYLPLYKNISKLRAGPQNRL